MEEYTRSNAEGMGAPQLEGFSVQGGVQMVGFYGKGTHKRLDLITRDQFDTRVWSVPVDSQRGEIVLEGGVPELQFLEVAKEAIETNHRIVGAGRVSTEDEQAAFTILAILLETPSAKEAGDLVYGNGKGLCANHTTVTKGVDLQVGRDNGAGNS